VLESAHLWRKKGFGEKKKKEADHVEDNYKGKKSQFQIYNTPSSSSQIININFNSLKLIRKPNLQKNQVKNQTEFFKEKTTKII